MTQTPSVGRIVHYHDFSRGVGSALETEEGADMTKYVVEIAVHTKGDVTKEAVKAWVAEALARRMVPDPNEAEDALTVLATGVRKIDID